MCLLFISEGIAGGGADASLLLPWGAHTPGISHPGWGICRPRGCGMTHILALWYFVIKWSVVSEVTENPHPTARFKTHLRSLQCDTGSRINTALPFHSFKVTLGELLWAPTQIILDELPPSHFFLYITAPHHIPRRREGKQIQRGSPHRVVKWQGNIGGVTHIVSLMSWQCVPLFCTA